MRSIFPRGLATDRPGQPDVAPYRPDFDDASTYAPSASHRAPEGIQPLGAPPPYSLERENARLRRNLADMQERLAAVECELAQLRGEASTRGRGLLRGIGSRL